MHSFLRYHILSLLLTTDMLANTLPNTKLKRVIDYEWAAIGDSWASGVRASDSEDYIKGSQECLRTNYAYGPQLESDPSWNGGDKENFHFAACSGATLGDMVKGQKQINNTGKPHLITMTAGGNNAKFFDIATNCIYQQNDDVDYGKEYADDKNSEGLCAKSIKASNDYLTGANSKIGKDLNNTLFDVVGSTQFKTYSDTLLYVTGYAHFFAVDDNWCDKWSFGAKASRRPKLTLKLRKAINELTEKLNNAYKLTIANYPSKQIRYVSITEGFQGSRFCEVKPAYTPDIWWYNRQYYGNYVRFWNVVLPALQNKNPNSDATSVPNPMDGFTGKLFTFTTDIPGWQQRPFHPKSPGYTAIKDAIIAQMKIDKLPQSPPTSTSTALPSPTTCIAGKYKGFNACQSHCFQGQCQENAGQPQITCACQ